MSNDVKMRDDTKPPKKELPTLDESRYQTPAEFNEMESMKKLFAGSIPKDSTDDEIREYFAKFGEIQEMTVMRKENNPAVFAFVIYANCDTVDEVLQKRPIMFKEKELQCKRAVPKDDNCDTAHYRTKKIFFANVLPETTEEEVHEYLVRRHPSKFGKIVDVTLIRKKKTKEGETEELSTEHKGYGFITCENEDLADRIALGDRKCKVLASSDKEQEFKKARPKDGGFGGRGGGYSRGGRGGKGTYGGGQGYNYGGWGGGWGGYGGYGGYGGGGYAYSGYGGW